MNDSVFFFPTECVLVDDEAYYHRALEEQTECFFSNGPTFKSVAPAIKYISENDKRGEQFIKRHLSSVKTTGSFPASLVEEAFNLDRFRQVSVIVADYCIGQHSGITFLQEVKNPYTRKILLTAFSTDPQIAQAQNSGTVHRCISKRANSTEWIQAAEEEQDLYFRKITSEFLKTLALSDQESLILSPLYKNFMQQMMKECNAVERYLFETSGSSLLIDIDGQSYTLFIRSTDQILSSIMEAKNLSNQIFPIHLQKQLKDKKALLCLYSDSNIDRPFPENWHHFVYPANPVPNCPGFYFSLVKDSILSQKIKKKIVSFKTFRKTLENT